MFSNYMIRIQPWITGLEVRNKLDLLRTCSVQWKFHKHLPNIETVSLSWIYKISQFGTQFHSGISIYFCGPLLHPITPFWKCWLILVTSGTIKLSIMSTTPQSTSQSTPMNPKLTPTVHCNPLHPSSHLILSTDSPENPDNPGMNTDQPPTGALRHPSPP